MLPTTSGSDEASLTRAIRRLQGLPPAFGLLPDGPKITNAATTTMVEEVTSPIILQQPREPPSFRGAREESSLTNWAHIKREFLKTFATVVRKKRGAILLETRTQHHNEGVMIFVEEMKRLFRLVDQK